MDPAMVSEAGCASGGLQMLLNRWRLQEEKLLDFEDSLKEVNESMAYQPVQETRVVRHPETALQRKLSVLGGDILDTGVQDGMFRVPSALSMTSSDDDCGLSLRKGTYEGDEVIAMVDESMEDFEKRIWGTVWKDEALLDDYIVDGSCPCTFLDTNLQGEYSELAPIPASVLLENDLRGNENAVGEELRPHSLFQQDFHGLPVRRASPSTVVENDNFATPSGLEVIPQSSIRPCLDRVVMSHSFGSDPRSGTTGSDDLEVLVESKKFPLACEKEESLEMAVNLVSPELLWSSSQSNEECSNLNELSTQRGSFVESIMAAEAQRQMDREKEQLRRAEALKQEEEAAASMERVLQNPLQLEQEEKQTSIDEEACLRQQRLEELQRELESSNAHLKKLTDNWEFFGKETDLNPQSVAEYFNSRRLEEERRNTAAQRIARAFRKRKCRVLHNCCISIQKWVRGFLCRQKVQELKGQRCKVMRVLATAVEEGSVSMLIEISAEACEVGLLKELDVMKLEFARRRVARLPMSDETCQSQSSPQLQALLMEAGSMGLEEGKLQELLQSMAKSRDAALKRLIQVAKVGSWDEYECCVDRALALGLEEQVDAIQGRWEAAKAEVSGWLRLVASSWGIGSRVVSEKVREARRLGLTTLAEEVPAAVSEKESNVLAGLEASMTTGALKTFYEWLRSARLFDMREAVEEYSARFRQRVLEVRQQLMQATVRNIQEKSVKQLLLVGSGFGLETEVAVVVRQIRRQILMFVKELIDRTRQSVSRGDDLLGKWRELHGRGKGFGLGAAILKDLLQSIESSVLLEHTKSRRSIFAMFECDLMGFPVSYDCETRRASLNATALTLRYSASHSETRESGRKQLSEAGALERTPPLVTCCISWHEVDKLRSRWIHQFSQPFLMVLASRSAAGGGLVVSKPPQSRDGNGQCCTREGRSVGTVEGIEEAPALDSDHEDGDGDDEYWHTPRSPKGRGVQSLATCTLTRKMLEASAQCNRTELRRVVKLSLTHEDLTSLGVGLLGRWCPKLQIFMMEENRLSSLKGAFQGCEGSLEYVLVKDNLLNDFKGLESLQNLKVLFLAGNFISYIGPGTEVHRDADVVVVVDATAGTGVKTTVSSGGSGVYTTSTPRASCRSWQGTPRFLEDRNDPRACLTSRKSLAHRARSLWPKLKKLCLGNNRIGRVWELGSLCPNLEVLDLGSNELVTLGGCEGRALAGLKNLRLLDVGQNKLKGRSLWKGLSHCPLLVSLVASRNRLTELPTHLGSVMLREIWLNGNSITTLACKAWLPNLQRFYLQENLIDNLESLWGCPSLEVLDISFNHLADLSQLWHLSSLRRLRTLQMNDNPVSDQEEHVDKVLEAVPWLTELDNEPVEDSFREKSVQSIFLKHMQAAGIQFLQEKAARGERPFFSVGNPKEVARQWLGSGSSFRSSSDQFSWTSLAASADHGGNSISEAANRDIIETMHGKAKGAVLLAALFDLHRMAGASPILKAQLISPRGSDLHPLEPLPCQSATEANWNCLAFQEMFESHRKSHSWSKETSLRKEFLVQECKFGLQPTEKGVRNFGNDSIMDTPESHNVDPYLTDYLERTDCKYQDVYKENVEYKTEIEDQLVKIRRVQAFARGMLARKRHMRMQKLAVEALMAREVQRVSEKRRFQTSVLRIQAAWRGWVLKKAMRSATKLQAVWRGFVARKRFRQALCRLRYIDDDDFEYASVDENEFSLDPIVLEDEYSLFCKLRPSEEPGVGYLCKQEPAILAVGSVKEDHEPSLRDSRDTCVATRVDKAGGMEVAALSENQSSGAHCEETGAENQSSERAVDSCSRPHVTPESAAKALFDDPLRSALPNEQAETSTVLQSKDHKTSLKETPLVTSRSGLQQSTTESSPRMKGHVCGKELQAEKKKAAIAEIAKEWGFHDEKTAESYMKARTRVQKMLEKKNAGHQGAQTRLKLFKARSEEALAHSPPQHTHPRRIPPRVSCKVEKETVPIPSENIALVDETLECWHPPAALPALVPHVRQARLQKAKLRKSCPAWVAPSPGKLAMEVRDYASDEKTASWDGWQSSLHCSLVANEADAHAGHRMFHAAADTRKHHRRIPFLAVLKKDATSCRR